MAQSETGGPIREDLRRFSGGLTAMSEFLEHISREIKKIPDTR
jgi:hypothetical protein